MADNELAYDIVSTILVFILPIAAAIIAYDIKRLIESSTSLTSYDSKENSHNNALGGVSYQEFLDNYQNLVAGSQDSKSKSSSIPTNCKNCGAPLHGNRCKFCDTEYN